MQHSLIVLGFREKTRYGKGHEHLFSSILEESEAVVEFCVADFEIRYRNFKMVFHNCSWYRTSKPTKICIYQRHLLWFIENWFLGKRSIHLIFCWQGQNSVHLITIMKTYSILFIIFETVWYFACVCQFECFPWKCQHVYFPFICTIEIQKYGIVDVPNCT